MAQAEAARPDLLALDRDIEAARLAGDAAARSRIPEPEVVAGLKTTNVGDDRRGSVLSLVASIPLFDRAQPGTRSGRGPRASGDRRTRRPARGDWRDGAGAPARGRRAAGRGRRLPARERFPKSDELRRIAQVSYDAGERGILELLDAYRTAADARLRLAELDAAVAHAEIDLELATAVEIRK